MSRRKKIVVAVIAATVLGIATVGCAEAPSEESAEAAKPKKSNSAGAAESAEQPAPKSVKKQLREEQLANPEPDELVVTAEMVVDVTFSDPAAKRQFCEAYEMVGDAGFKPFAASYGKPVEGAPSAREVFEESASRC